MYKLNHLSIDESGRGGFEVGVSYVKTSDASNAIVSFPRRYQFPFETDGGYSGEMFGASNTHGMFGGVEHESQRAYSAECERSIGDLLTCLICETLENGSTRNQSYFVFGPSFPKIVGRLASLRLSKEVEVDWICPQPLPRWVAEGVDDASLLRRYRHGRSTESWEEEALIAASEFVLKDQSRYIVQRLQMWHQRKPEVNLEGWCYSMTLECWAPREIVVAASILALSFGTGFEIDPNGGMPAISENQDEPLFSTPIANAPQRPMFSGSNINGWEIEWI